MEGKIQTLIDDLTGTTNSLESKCEDLGLDPLSPEVTGAVDQQIFQCTECSWWCEMHDESSEFCGHDEWICGDCARDNHGWNGEE